MQQPSVKEGLDLMPSPSIRLYIELFTQTTGTLLEHCYTHKKRVSPDFPRSEQKSTDSYEV